MNVLVFAGDINDVAQRRRIAALRALGHDLRIISFRKSSQPTQQSSDHLDLGEIRQQSLLLRVFLLIMAIPKIWHFTRTCDRPQCVLARNLDMLCIALMTVPKSAVVYECLDIHGIFVNGGLKQILARFVERIVLRRIAKLVVSSTDFVTQYFVPIHGYKGDWALLENKLWLGKTAMARPEFSKLKRHHNLRLGWIGNIRCPDSLNILLGVADHCPNVEIHIFGHIHSHALPHFSAQIKNHPNMTYHGPYKYPCGLATVYAHCDVIWAQDLWQSGTNSDWLLPNRIYEAGYYGCPSIAVAGTATGRMIDDLNIGFTITAANTKSLVELISSITAQDLRDKRAEILAMPDSIFVQTLEEVRAAITIAPNDLPNFIGIGAMRAGTSTLYKYCADHPEIGVSVIKETDFYISQKNWKRGLNWYRSLFPKGMKCTGEFSPNYAKEMAFSGVPKRIFESAPQTKFIFIVRDPVDRAISQYTHSYLMGLNPPALDDLVGSHEWDHLVDTSSYAKQLDCYYQFFDPSQILVLDFETLKFYPHLSLSRVAAFLDVADTWNTSIQPVENAANSLAQTSKFALILNQTRFAIFLKTCLPSWAKKQFKRLMRSPKKRCVPVFNDVLRAQLQDALAADTARFEQMTNISFGQQNHLFKKSV